MLKPPPFAVPAYYLDLPTYLSTYLPTYPPATSEVSKRSFGRQPQQSTAGCFCALRLIATAFVVAAA